MSLCLQQFPMQEINSQSFTDNVAVTKGNFVSLRWCEIEDQSCVFLLYESLLFVIFIQYLTVFLCV